MNNSTGSQWSRLHGKRSGGVAGLLVAFLLPFTVNAQTVTERRAAIATRSQLPRATLAHATVIGVVLDEGLEPVVDAVVVSDAGGQAVTDATGSYSLETSWPMGAMTLHVTAVSSQHGHSRSATLGITPADRGATIHADPLILAESAGSQHAWLPTFGGQPGVNQAVRAMAVFDDGRGEGLQLYVGGDFSYAGSEPAAGLARWNGRRWSAVGDGSIGTVRALVVWDDGTGAGPRLIVGGDNVAALDGQTLNVLGGGLTQSFASPMVSALAVHDDGSGPALHVGGYFDKAGGLPAKNVARWDGSAWSALGAGLGGDVLALASHDAGQGAVLYAGGSFVTSGAALVKGMAQWDGTAWSAVAGGSNGPVNALLVGTLPGASAPTLLAGGDFNIMGSIVVHNLASWDGSSWSAIADGVNGPLRALALHDAGDGNGSTLYVAGDFSIPGDPDVLKIARWDGLAWEGLAPGFGEADGLYSLVTHDDIGSSGPALFVGGSFDLASGVPAMSIARFGDETWTALGTGFDGPVTALAAFDDGSGAGPELYAAGDFTTAGGVPATRLARWDGAGWHPVGGPLDRPVRALAVYDDGNGAMLVAAGEFEHIGETPFDHVAAWNGASWVDLFAGMENGDVYCLAVWDDGQGPALYCGGSFTTAGFGPANHIVRWNGSGWSKLGTGTDAPVRALAVYADANGPALYAGGSFHTAGGVVAHGLARWDGTTWSAVGSGVIGSAGTVTSLAAFRTDDGSRLIAGGAFSTQLGAPANHLAAWDGVAWSAIDGSPDGQVECLSVQTLRPEPTPVLYVAGSFLLAGGAPVNGMARWDGSTWSGLGNGGGGAATFFSFNDGGGQVMWVGGYFQGLVDSGDSYLSRWGSPSAESAWTDLGFSLPGVSGAPFLAGTGSLEPGTSGSLNLRHARPNALAILYMSTSSRPMSFRGGQLVPGSGACSLVNMTDAAGAASFAWTSAPAGLPSGLTIFFQDAIEDSSAAKGVALSNALRATVP